jgi:hypothetical protein
MDGGREWHTAQVRSWMLAHPEVVARVRGQDSWALYPLALQLAARAAREQLSGVDFRQVDWDAAVSHLEASAAR